MMEYPEYPERKIFFLEQIESGEEVNMRTLIDGQWVGVAGRITSCEEGEKHPSIPDYLLEINGREGRIRVSETLLFLA